MHLDPLRTAELHVEGRLVAASNTTLFCRLGSADEPDDGRLDLACVYKPVAGERPLWDFPTGTLAAREVAAYEVSARAGWHLVPPTVLRDGPFGPGMCQLWVEHEAVDALVDIVPEGEVPAGWFGVVDAQDGAGDPVTLVHADTEPLRRTALFDAVINNADRKAGHLLPTPDGLRVVDHGVAFHVDPKLRTVLWGWAGASLSRAERRMLQGVRDGLEGELGSVLADLLEADEIEATYERVDLLLHVGCFPVPGEGWPSLPWPPF